VPAQGIEVKPGSGDAPPVRRAPPAGVVEQPVELERIGAKLSGVLWMPAGKPKPVPMVLVIAGSGPVDRDGNSGGLLRTDTYRLLAQALAQKGVATLRYDKRGVALSTYAGKLDDLSFDDFVNDAAAMVAWARSSGNVSSVYLFGHSEGALIALSVATKAKIDGIISAAGAGRPVVDVAREQLAKQLPPEEMKEYGPLVDALKAGKPLEAKSVGLKVLFQPQLAKFLRGMLLTDPKPLAAAFKGPLTVLQGDNDIQVSVDRDAKPLAAAHAGAKLVVLKDVAHPLKVDAKKGTDQPSYNDPSLPLAAGVVDAVMATIR
jgi:pimeloyl-ACP methyl ester carboxylesterase